MTVDFSKNVRVLCIAESPDRPTTALIIGLKQSGIEIQVMCPRGAIDYAALQAEGIPLLDHYPKRTIEPATVSKIRRLIKKNQFDILHVFGNRAITNAIVASLGLPVRLVTYRGIVGNLSFLDPIFWMRYLNPRIDRIVCVAESVRRFFLEMKPAFLRLPAERLVTIYKGHDLTWYQKRPGDRGEFGIPPRAFIAGCVANFRPRKGIDVLVDALALLPEELEVHLLLVGRMQERKLERRIASSPMKERIHLTGFRQDAPQLMAACDVFVLPSLRREGLARSAIESMAYGTPPIVTDCGGSPELVENGVSGIVVPAADPAAIAAALRWMVQHPEERRRMGEAARERIRTDFNVRDTIRQTVELYRSIVLDSRRASSAEPASVDPSLSNADEARATVPEPGESTSPRSQNTPG